MLGEALRRIAPEGLKERVRHSDLYLKHRSEATNVYHCCVQKTASRWIRKILTDGRVFRYSGLDLYDYHAREGEDRFDPRPPTEVRVSDSFPPGTVATPLYVDFAGFRSIPKPREYRAFFVMRDPRDITVSWYFSMRDSHPTGGGLLTPVRERLRTESKHEGLKTAIDLLGTRAGLYPALRSWAEADLEGEPVVLSRYEDLIGEAGYGAFHRLLEHCDIRIPRQELAEILEEYAFRRMSGRERGNEDSSAHLRKGIAGDWKNHFDEDLLSHFRSRTDDLLELLGYGEGG